MPPPTVGKKMGPKKGQATEKKAVKRKPAPVEEEMPPLPEPKVRKKATQEFTFDDEGESSSQRNTRSRTTSRTTRQTKQGLLLVAPVEEEMPPPSKPKVRKKETQKLTCDDDGESSSQRNTRSRASSVTNGQNRQGLSLETPLEEEMPPPSKPKVRKEATQKFTFDEGENSSQRNAPGPTSSRTKRPTKKELFFGLKTIKCDPIVILKYKLPEPLPKGILIKGFFYQKWILGDIIASGGFGTVYRAVNKKKPRRRIYAIKVDNHNGLALGREQQVYITLNNPDKKANWMKENKRHYVGISPWYNVGSFEHNSSKYDFLVIHRYGMDLQKLLDENKTFPLKTVCLIGISVIWTLEYVHSYDYLHNDVKAANLLLGNTKATENQVYLVDMGGCTKYLMWNPCGMLYEHVEDCPDPIPWNGTTVYKSRDAHRGCVSRRSDLEMLAFNILEWLTGPLPWFLLDNKRSGSQLLSYERAIEKEKNRYMNDIDNFLSIQFQKEKVPVEISLLFHYINDLQFKEKPDYCYCRNLLEKMLESAGYSSTDHALEFTKKGNYTGD